jgi:Tol biopolymer transport system component
MTNSRQSDSTAGWVAYVVDEGRFLRNEIFLMRADGSHPRQVTHSNAEKIDVAWSPDGGWFVFSQFDVVGDSSSYHLYQINPNGHAIRKLTMGDFQDTDPHVSPDGNVIIMYSNRDGLASTLFRMDADGSNIARLTSPEIRGHNPLWSPDGEWIYFLNTERGIFRIRPNGTDMQPLIDMVMMSTPFTMSPDGEQVALLIVETPEYVLRIMPSDGGEMELLATDVWWDSNLVWSPDGHWLAYVGFDEATISSHIALIHPDGSDRHAILVGHPDLPIISDITWSPDGKWISFAGGSGNQRDLYRIRPDGRDLQRLTYHNAEAIVPTYSPIIDLPLSTSTLFLLSGILMIVSIGLLGRAA